MVFTSDVFLASTFRGSRARLLPTLVSSAPDPRLVDLSFSAFYACSDRDDLVTLGLPSTFITPVCGAYEAANFSHLVLGCVLVVALGLFFLDFTALIRGLARHTLFLFVVFFLSCWYM